MRKYNLTQLLLGVENALPTEAELARVHATTGVKGWDGAPWADALDSLYDTDSLLDVTEPMWDALHEQVTDNKRLIALVSITLSWAWQRPPTSEEVLAGIVVVEAYLAEHAA